MKRCYPMIWYLALRCQLTVANLCCACLLSIGEPSGTPGGEHYAKVHENLAYGVGRAGKPWDDWIYCL